MEAQLKFLHSWGGGQQGQLGLGGEVQSITTPTEILELSNDDIAFIEANGDVSAAITRDG